MNIWRKLKGRKDDMYILDRCGKVVEHMPARKTFMLRKFARSQYLKAYRGRNTHSCPGCET